MKKVLLGFLLVLGMSFALGACESADNSASSNLGQSSGVVNGNSGTSDSEKEDVCEVVFKQAGCVDVIRTIDKGETLSDIPNPVEKMGYTVVWDRTDFSNITEDLVVNAIITANTYTVTYDANGGTIATETQEVTYDAETTLVTPEKEDYLFLGWTYNGNAVVSGAKWTIAKSVILVATWQDNRPTYTVKFVDGTKSMEITVKKGESVADVDVPAFVGKTGYSVKWDKVDYTNIQADMTVTAEYTPNKYTITYEADGFAIDGRTVELTYDALCTALDMSLKSKENNFLGWKYGDATYTQSSTWNVAGDVTLAADWAPKDQVVVTFTDTDGTRLNKAVYQGENLTDIPTPTAKKGYTVDKENWYADKACTIVATFTNLQNDTTVYAKATANKYTVTYNANGGSVENITQQVTYDADYTLATPTHEESYMRFDGWKDENGNTITSGKWSIEKDSFLTAQWTDTRATFTISFVQAGQEMKTFTVKEGEMFVDIPAVVSKIGYNVQWDEKALAKLSNVTENVEVVAVETVKTYTVMLNPAGGTVSQSSITVAYGEEYQLPLPSKKGYTFKYWTYENKKISMSGIWSIDAENIELIAVWIENEWTGNY